MNQTQSPQFLPKIFPSYFPYFITNYLMFENNCSSRNLFILLIPRRNYSFSLTFLTYTYLGIHIIYKGNGYLTN